MNSTLYGLSNGNNTIAKNYTSKQPDHNSEDGILFTLIINIIMATFIIIVNSIVLVLFFTKPKLRKSASNKILSSLVISDLSTGLILIPHTVAVMSSNLRTPTTPSALAYRISLDIATTWIQLASMGNLTLIIIERYITLIFPYKVDKCLSSKRVVSAILAVWAIALMIPCTQLTWLYKLFRGNTSKQEYAYINRADSMFSIATIVLFGFLPMVVLLFMFFRMFQEIQTFPVNDKMKKRKEEKRVLTIFAMMYVSFMTFSLPYFVARIIIDIDSQCNVPKYILTTAQVFRIITPLTNPFVYVLNKPDFRRVLRKPKTYFGRMGKNISYQQPRTMMTLMTNSRRPSNDPSIQKLVLLKDVINNNYNDETKWLPIVLPNLNNTFTKNLFLMKEDKL